MGFLRDWEGRIAAAALAIVFAAVTWGVLARYVSPRPAVWANELATIGFAWIVFIGAAAGARERLHIGVDLATARLPPAAQRRIAVGVSLFLAVALGYIAWLAVQIGLKSISRPTPVMRLPSSIVHVAVVLGFASIALGCLRDAFRMMRGQMTGDRP